MTRRFLLEQVLRKHGITSGMPVGQFTWEALLSDLLVLWPEPEPPRWCQHCVWDEQYKEWVLHHSADLFNKDDATVSSIIRSREIDHRQWKYCPICAAPRPASGGG